MNLNATLLGQIVAFLVFIWFCMQYVWPFLMRAMQDRQRKIADGLEAADRAQRDLRLAQENARLKIHEAKQEASVIIEAANKKAAQIIDESKMQAREEGHRLKAAAQADIAQEVNRAKEHLRLQVAALAVAGASKILDAIVDEQAHSHLVSQLMKEL